MEQEKIQIPYGYCHCGCGQKTKISKMTRGKLGYRRGEPSLYLPGHASKGKARPYWENAKVVGPNGQVRVLHYREKHLEHRIIAELAMGKPLPIGAEVHHVNCNPTDNKNNNLVVCEDSAYHKLLHRRARALEACGHADWMKCNYCHQYADPMNLQISPNGRRVCHLECGAKYNAEYNARVKRRKS